MSYPAQLEQIQKKYDDSVKAVLNDRDRSEEWRKRVVQEIYSDSRQEFEATVEEARAKVELDLRVARRMAFQPRLQGSKDPVVLWDSYRRCIEKAKQLKTSAEVREAMNEANLIGDEIMAKALLLQAYSLQDTRAVADYLDERPQEDRLWSDFMDKAEVFNKFSQDIRFLGTGARIRKPEEFKA